MKRFIAGRFWERFRDPIRACLSSDERMCCVFDELSYWVIFAILVWVHAEIGAFDRRFMIGLW